MFAGALRMLGGVRPVVAAELALEFSMLVVLSLLVAAGLRHRSEGRP